MELLTLLIAKKQDGFVKGCHIIDGIILMHEMLHFIKVKKEKVFIIKLDMEKAYDIVN